MANLIPNTFLNLPERKNNIVEQLPTQNSPMFMGRVKQAVNVILTNETIYLPNKFGSKHLGYG